MSDKPGATAKSVALETEVGKWLQENRAEDFAEAFYKAGFLDIVDVTDEEIDTIVKATSPGTAARLKRMRGASRQKPEKKDPIEAPAIPALPAGTAFDLSQKELKSPDGIVFSVPTELSASASSEAVISPLGLKPEDWMTVARGRWLLHGYTMEDFTEIKPPLAEHPVLEWVVPAGMDFVTAEELSAEVTANLCYTEHTASYVRSGFDKEAASGSYMFCSASFEREHKEKEASQSSEKILQMIGRWYYPRATLDLAECTRASPAFVAALEAALASPTRSKALFDVFQQYGTAVPRKVTLGGQLDFNSVHLTKGEVNEKSAEDTIKAAVSFKVGAAKGDVSFSTGTATDATVSSQSIANSQSFRVLGGDASLANNPQAWPATVKNPHLWEVIARHGLRSTLDLLDGIRPELKAQVLQVAIPPAMLPAQDLPIQSESVKADTAAFVLGTRESDSDGPGGSVSLVCSPSSDPRLTDTGAVGSAAFAHFHAPADMHVPYNSLCLPVPVDSFYRTDTHDVWPGAKTRIARLPTRLSLGTWQPAFPGGSELVTGASRDGRASTDGFLFVAIHTMRDGERGTAYGEVSGVRMGAASVHWWSPHSNIEQDASFCLPVPSGADYKVVVAPTWGTPQVRAWWLPSTNPAWRFLAAVTRSVNTVFAAEADGILNAIISTATDGERGSLKLHAQSDLSIEPAQMPLACTSVHWWSPRDRWLIGGSAMLPVPTGLRYRAAYIPTCGTPAALAFWTAIVPRD